jgi:8-hydroxy-5-deazaflavin:NADPH oxidoreductase
MNPPGADVLGGSNKEAAMNVGVIGSGVVGETLANGFVQHGHAVMRGSREPGKLAAWKSKGAVGTFAETARYGEIVVLAAKGTAAEEVVRLCGPEALAGKTVIDAMNPIAEAPPQNGVLRFFTEMNESLMERLQKIAPKANFVKAFSCVGHAHFVNPDFGPEKPTMFICGNSAPAKGQVAGILATFGWDVEDMGGVEAARAIEPLCMLWCIPGFLSNRWTHAFRLLRR